MRITSLVFKKTVDSIKYIEFKYCDCGCGQTLSKYSIDNGYVRKDRPINYLPYHDKRGKPSPNRGKKFNDKWRKNLSEAHKAPRPYRKKEWDELTYFQKHRRIRNLKQPIPEFCESCGLIQPRELSNKSQKYLEDVTDWWDLCAKCHKIFDKIYERNLKPYNDKRKKKVISLDIL
jgi:hypothetical protein